MGEELKQRMNIVIKDVESIINDIKNNNLENEQDSLNFMDKLNALSVLF